MISVRHGRIVVSHRAIVRRRRVGRVVRSNIRGVLVRGSRPGRSSCSVVCGALRGSPDGSRGRTMLCVCHRLHGTSPTSSTDTHRMVGGLFFSRGECSLNSMNHCEVGGGLGLAASVSMHILAGRSVVRVVGCLVRLVGSGTSISSVSRLDGHHMHAMNRRLSGRFTINLTHVSHAVHRHVGIHSGRIFAPVSLVGTGAVSSIVGSFFKAGTLSRFVSRAGPLTRVARGHHVSTLNPNNLSHRHTKFRIHSIRCARCNHLYPVRAPRKPGVNLVSSLYMFTGVGSLKFVRAPCHGMRGTGMSLSSGNLVCLATRRRRNGIVTRNGTPLGSSKAFVHGGMGSHRSTSFPIIRPTRMRLVSISPRRVTSVTTSLVPFLRRSSTGHTLVKSGVVHRTIPLLEDRTPVMNANVRHRLIESSHARVATRNSNMVSCISTAAVHVLCSHARSRRFMDFRSTLGRCEVPGFHGAGRGVAVSLHPVYGENSQMAGNRVLARNCSARGNRLTLNGGLLITCVP